MTETAKSTAARQGARIKWTLLLALIVASGVVFLAWSQTWFVFDVRANSIPILLDVPGATASPALAALGLAGLALVAALAIAGPAVRLVLAIVGMILGGCIVLAAIVAMSDPVTAGIAAVGERTGVAGIESVRALVTTIEQTASPWLALVGGALISVVSAAVLVTWSRWPRSNRRFQPVVFENTSGERGSVAQLLADSDSTGTRAGSSKVSQADAEAAAASGRPSDAAVDDWDRLSAGQDPTERDAN